MESAVLLLIYIILYGHECFTGKHSTCKIHTKLHPGLEWRIFHIFTSSDSLLSSLSLKLYLNSLVYDRNMIFGFSSKVFGNLLNFCEVIVIFSLP